MLRSLIWSGVIVVVWILSMIHAEHVGMQEQVAKDRQTLNCNGSGNIKAPNNKGIIVQDNTPVGPISLNDSSGITITGMRIDGIQAMTQEGEQWIVDHTVPKEK